MSDSNCNDSIILYYTLSIIFYYTVILYYILLYSIILYLMSTLGQVVQWLSDSTTDRADFRP